MIIDLRTRITPVHEPLADDLDASPLAHAAAMKCVDASFVVGYRCDRLGFHTPAELIAAQVQADPGRRLGVAGIDPMVDSALDDVDRAADLGLIAISIAPADQACRATHDRCLGVLERAADHSMPVLIANPMLHQKTSVLELARPATLDEALRLVPRLTLVLGDLGAAWLDEAMLMIGRHENVYAEISGVVGRPWALYNTLLAAHERGVTGKLLFGSGFPQETPARVIERLYTINSIRGGSSLPAIPREAIRQIVERDALSCLGIDHVFEGASRTPRRVAVAPTTEATPAPAEPAVVTTAPARQGRRLLNNGH